MVRRLSLLAVLLASLPAQGAPARSCPARPRAQLLAKVRSFAVVLQSTRLHTLGSEPADLLVVDPSRTGSGDGLLSRDEVALLQCGPRGRRLVLAYLSVGEAEDYRDYWRDKFLRRPPPWLGPAEPDWPGNYKVRYWDRAWQDLVIAPRVGMLARILERGFDGVYLDRIDTMEFWSGRGVLSHVQARRRMAVFVRRIRDALDRVAGVENRALLAIQNPLDLGREPGIIRAVDAVGVEDLFRRGNARVAASETRKRQAELARFQAAGKPILAIAYPTRPRAVSDFLRRAVDAGYLPYVGHPKLDRLGLTPLRLH